MLIILFGPIGVGKSYIGKLLSSHYDFYYEDGDNWLTPEMLSVIEKRMHFTQEMIDNFVDVMITNIAALFESGHKNIVISQALYRQKNREKILRAFPTVKFIQVDARPDTVSRRLISRGNAVDEEFANLNKGYFEPMAGCPVIHNDEDGDEHILSDPVVTVLRQ